MKQTVLIFSTGLGFGGTSVVVSIAKQIAQRGWSVTFLVAVKPENQRKVDELESAGIRVLSLEMRRRRLPMRGFLRLLRLLRTLKPEILHCHSVHANLLGRVGRVFSPVPVVISSAHNINEGGRWRELGYRVTDGLADMTTQVSEIAAQRYIGIKAVSKKKMMVIPNGIDISAFRRNDKSRKDGRQELQVADEFVWLGIGRLRPQKNFPLMFRAFKIVLSEYSKALLVVVGDGPLNKFLRGYSKDLGIEENVRFLGVRGDVARVMNLADGFVLSSSWEGMPMVLLEAAACELPIVATNVGGVSEVFEHGKGGYLVPPGDETQLASHMVRVMQMPADVRGGFADLARKRVEKEFDIGKLGDRWDKLYSRLLNEKGL